MSERIQKVLANVGVASRRELETWIKAGRIKLNGKVAVLGDKANADDKITVDGKRINIKSSARDKRRVLIYHKKVGEICTRSDPEKRPSVFSNLPKLSNGRWVAVGRLDINTSGLLLFTNDGAFANQLMHPSSQVPREYAVRVRGQVTDVMLANLTSGVLLDDGEASFNDVVHSGGDNQNQWYHVVLLEGRNREVRRIWESQGLTVSRLKRVRYGTIVLTQKVRQGKTVELSTKEIKTLEDMLKPEEIKDDSKSQQEKKSGGRKQASTKKASEKKGSEKKDSGKKAPSKKTANKKTTAKKAAANSKPHKKTSKPSKSRSGSVKTSGKQGKR